MASAALGGLGLSDVLPWKRSSDDMFMLAGWGRELNVFVYGIIKELNLYLLL